MVAVLAAPPATILAALSSSDDSTASGTEGVTSSATVCAMSTLAMVAEMVFSPLRVTMI